MKRTIQVMDFQTAIATLDREVMEDITTTQFLRYGIDRTICATIVKGVPLYLLRCNNGISYVCTRAQAMYFTRKIGGDFSLKREDTAFRVYPALVNIQHKEKGAQYGTHYRSFVKSHEYEKHAVLAL